MLIGCVFDFIENFSSLFKDFLAKFRDSFLYSAQRTARSLGLIHQMGLSSIMLLNSHTNLILKLNGINSINLLAIHLILGLFITLLLLCLKSSYSFKTRASLIPFVWLTDLRRVFLFLYNDVLFVV